MALVLESTSKTFGDCLSCVMQGLDESQQLFPVRFVRFVPIFKDQSDCVKRVLQFPCFVQQGVIAV